MKTLQVSASSKDYLITVGKDLRFEVAKFLNKDYSKTVIITDEVVAALYLEDVKKSLPQSATFEYIIPSGESSKSIEMYYKLQTFLMEQHFDRDALVIALGGGVVGDLAGFVAATYMRGIDYVQVPTTILAHDSSVGGKVAVNHELGKNMIGSFYPPSAVIYDVATLRTLPTEQVRSGYAELIKEAFIADSEFLKKLLDQNLEMITVEDLSDHLYKGIEIKAAIVEQDEKESNIRKHLNFGHTLAHAIETEVGYGAVTHGEAVAIGMLFALQLSEDTFKDNLLYESYLKWLQHNHYPLVIHANAQALIELMRHDKKAHGGMLQFVLLEELAEPAVVDMKEDKVRAVLELFLKELNHL